MSANAKGPIDSWTSGGGIGFGSHTAADEELHPEHCEPVDSLTETWAYMFYEPEHRISAIVHVWVHPNLGVVTGGIGVWQGVKAHHLQAELFNVPVFTGVGNCVRANGRDLHFPTGLRIQIREPFANIHIGFTDVARQNHVDLTFTAASPPIMRESNKHFDQMLDVRGSITLRGRTYEMNGYGCRDRSWGEPRPEDPYPIPPYTWMTGRFPSGMMWHGNSHDDPTKSQHWLQGYSVKPEDVFKDGWIYRDGEALRLKSFSKTTHRDPVTARPMTHLIEMLDAKGRDYTIHGEVISGIPWPGWNNIVCWICCTRWRWNNEIGFGDTQEVQWTDFVRRYRTDHA